jgi:hypothetical protein
LVPLDHTKDAERKEIGAAGPKNAHEKKPKKSQRLTVGRKWRKEKSRQSQGKCTFFSVMLCAETTRQRQLWRRHGSERISRKKTNERSRPAAGEHVTTIAEKQKEAEGEQAELPHVLEQAIHDVIGLEQPVEKSHRELELDRGRQRSSKGARGG